MPWRVWLGVYVPLATLFAAWGSPWALGVLVLWCLLPLLLLAPNLPRRTMRGSAPAQPPPFAEVFGHRGHRLGPEVENRALGLLWGALSPKQRRELVDGEPITVEGSAGGAYWIDQYGQVRSHRRMQRRAYCVGLQHPRCPAFPSDRSYPFADAILAKKLMIETDEPGFERVANAWPI